MAVIFIAPITLFRSNYGVMNYAEDWIILHNSIAEAVSVSLKSKTGHYQVGKICLEIKANHCRGGKVCQKSEARHCHVGKVCLRFWANHYWGGIAMPEIWGIIMRGQENMP